MSARPILMVAARGLNRIGPGVLSDVRRADGRRRIGAGLRAEARPSAGILIIFGIVGKPGPDGFRREPRLHLSGGTPRGRFGPDPLPYLPSSC